MFIKSTHERRINFQLITEYRPFEKTSGIDKIHYFIELTHSNGNIENIHFFENSEERDKFLNRLDSIFLKG
jgi:hypothetical protein